jgi:uncharacterized RDD family membrane protein YckC
MNARLVTLIIDGLVLGIPLTVVGLVLGVIRIAGNQTLPHSSLGPRLIFYAIELCVLLCYYAYLDGTLRGTIGRRATGIAVVDIGTGQHIGFTRALLREGVLLLTALPCGVGYFSPLIDRTGMRRGWHDRVARTVVIHSSPPDAR